MVKKQQRFDDWIIQIMDNGSVTVLKDGNICSVAKSELTAIAAANKWPIEEGWTTQELGKFVVDVLEMSKSKSIRFDGRTTVDKLKRYFKCVYNVSLRVYDNGKLADNSKKLSELRSDGAKNTGMLECRANITVGSLIQRVKEQFGLDIKIATQDDWVLVLNGITLANAGTIKKGAVLDDMKGMEGYQREESPKAKTTDSVIKCSTKSLQYWTLHDPFDEWTILFADDNLEPLSEDALANLKDGLYKYLKSFLYVSSGLNKHFESDIREEEIMEGYLYDKFDLEIRDGVIQTVDQYNLPIDFSLVDSVDQTLGAILTFAKNNGVNVVARLWLVGAGICGAVAAIECAALIDGQPSCFEFIGYEDMQDADDDEFAEERDQDVWYDDDNNAYDKDYIVEILHDLCRDNFEKSPWWLEENPDEEEEERREEVDDKLYKLIEKTVFPQGID